jgi:hypothetical protein
MNERKLRCINWQEALKQNGLKRLGNKTAYGARGDVERKLTETFFALSMC